jgi:hypothetical protein
VERLTLGEQASVEASSRAVATQAGLGFLRLVGGARAEAEPERRDHSVDDRIVGHYPRHGDLSWG